MTITYEKFSAKLVKVKKDGSFIGWLQSNTRRTTGLHSELITTWCGKIDGTGIHASTLG